MTVGRDVPRVLYIVNFYGTPPLNFFEKYIKESQLLALTVLKLPSVRPTKGKFVFEAFLADTVGKNHNFNVSFPFPLPPSLAFGLQYLFNVVALIYLLGFYVREKFDICIGETAFGSAAAFCLRVLHVVSFSVYMSGDVLPELDNSKPFYFGSSKKLDILLDFVYIRGQYFLRWLGMKNDLIWYASPKVHSWDNINGFIAKDFITFPAVTVDAEEVKRNVTCSKSDNTLVYIGRLDEHAGVDILLESMAVLKQRMPEVQLLVVGGGSLTVEKYRNLARGLGVEDSVNFFGFVATAEDTLEILCHAKVGVAMYKPSKDNVSMYADVSKPKEYIRAGVPVIITKDGPEIAKEIETFSAGIAVEYSAASVANALLKIFRDDLYYKKLLAGVVSYGEANDYREIFRNLVSTIVAKWEAR